MNAPKRSCKSLVIREADDFEIWPRPASEQSEETSRIEEPGRRRVFSGSVVNSRFEQRGKSFEAKGSAAAQLRDLDLSLHAVQASRPQPLRLRGGASGFRS